MRNIISVLMLLVLVYKSPVIASGFIGVGSGALYTEESDGDFSGMMVPAIVEFEYSPGFRDSLMFSSSFHYLNLFQSGFDNDVFVYSAGVRYTPEFYFYKSNITKHTFDKNSCIGILLLPFTTARDMLITSSQILLPVHPFVMADFAVIQYSGDFKPGFSTALGVTSGFVDIKLIYTQNLGYSQGFNRDIYMTGAECTFHFPLQEKFLREKPLVD